MHSGMIHSNVITEDLEVENAWLLILTYIVDQMFDVISLSRLRRKLAGTENYCGWKTRRVLFLRQLVLPLTDV